MGGWASGKAETLGQAHNLAHGLARGLAHGLAHDLINNKPRFQLHVIQKCRLLG